MPLIFVGIACVVNILGDLLLVAVLKMDAAGAAIATVAAQAASVLLAVRIIRMRTQPFPMSLSKIRLNSEVGALLKIGAPVAFQEILTQLSFLMLCAFINRLGLEASSGYGVANKIVNFIMLIPSSLMQSMAALVAQNVGAGKKARARKALVTGMGIGCSIGVVIALLAVFGGEMLSGIFSSDTAVIKKSAEYLMGFALEAVVTSILFSFIGYFNGHSQTLFVMLQGLAQTFLVRIPMSYFMSIREEKMKIKKISIMLLICMIAVSAFTACKMKADETTENADYSVKIFDQSYVHTINIEIDEADWSDLCANPTAKTKYPVNVTIDDEIIKNVSFATKGNTSLTEVADNPESDRYSFKVNFGKYVEGQTYHGLEKLHLNNIYADATYMKDYISYEIFRAAGVKAPLTSYVQLCINGKEFGCYLAVEDIGTSYLIRNNENGELYKPETEMFGNIENGMQGGGMPQMPNGEAPQMPDGEMPQMPDGETPQMPDGEMPQMPDGETPQMPDGEMPQMPDGEIPQMANEGMEDFSGSSKGAALVYIDDELSSYSDIFDNAVTDVTEEDERRVITALKQLSQKNVETSIDTESVIRYFVAHNFVMNYDSYTGNMLHNYYLYENDSKLSILPWDYNLAFGGFAVMNMDATGLINCGIDTPLSGASDNDRPMWGFIAENEEYLEQYHKIFDGLIADYFESGNFEKEINRIYEMIRPYVEKDASAFYTVEEFDVAYDNLLHFCKLRAQSIREQLNGNLSADTEKQKTENMIDASSISVEAMGTQNKNVNHDMKNDFRDRIFNREN